MKEAPLHLEDLIEKLAKCNPDNEVYFDYENRPVSHLISWRGVYAELSLDSNHDGKAVKTGELLENCRTAIGKEFTGYKGGEFVMSEHSLVYADEYSTASGFATCDVVEKDGKTIIETIRVNSY